MKKEKNTVNKQNGTHKEGNRPPVSTPFEKDGTVTLERLKYLIPRLLKYIPLLNKIITIKNELSLSIIHHL